MEEKILQFLKEMSPEKIKRSTDKETFLRGQKYATQNKTLSFTWDNEKKGQQRLLAYVSGTTTYQVSFSCVNKNICIAICNCPAWTRVGQCKHTICALLAAHSALCNSDKANSKLRAGILNESGIQFDNTVSFIRPESTSHIQFSPHFLLNTYKHQQLVPTSFFTTTPNLSKLNKTHYFLRDREEEECALIQALTNELKNSKLYISTPTEENRVNTSNNAIGSVRSLIELDLDDNTLNIRRLVASGNNIFYGPIIRISNHIVFIKEVRELAAVNEENPWEWVDKAILPNFWEIEYLRNDATARMANSSPTFPDLAIPIKLPIDYFNKKRPMIYPADRRSTVEEYYIFKIKNKITKPVIAPVEMVVNATFNTDSTTVKITALAKVDGCATPLFKLIARYIATIERLSSWLKTKKRKPMLIKGLLGLLNIHTEKEATNHIKIIIKNLIATYDGEVNKFELNSYFTQFVSELNLTIESIFICNNTIYFLPLNYRRFCHAARIIAHFFDDWTIEYDADSISFSLKKEIFQDRLTEFSTLLNEDSIQFNINNKKFKIINLDISIDASDRTSSDWFKLDPEILADGIKLTPEQREALFDADGTIESQDCFKMLDKKSQEIIKILAKIFQQSHGESRFNNNHRIVEMPRLHILTLLELRKKGAQVKLSNEDEEIIDNLTNFSTIKKISISPTLCGELREYQKQGYNWLAFLYRHRFGACLADDMGLGKTIQAIAFLSGIASGTIASRTQKNIPHLIIVPATLVFNWIQELHKFSPDLKVLEYTNKSRKLNFDEFDIIITTYDRARLDIEALKQIDFHVLILDEAQAIKNIKAGRSSAIRQLRSLFTISLTGTPLENHIGEYYSIIDIALPGILPAYKTFMHQVQTEEQGNLIRRTKPFVLRRTKEAILHELPPKIENNITLNMTEKQQKLYATTVREIKRIIDRAYQEKTAAKANIIALTAILRLRQICISPQIIDTKADLDSPKIDYLVTALTEIIQEKNAALVFSQFTSCLDMVEAQLKKAGIKFLRIDGKTPMQQRKKIVATFQDENSPISVLLLSLKTGGVGLNLTRASYVYHLDPWWNPAVENQASDRAHRIGQKNSVFINRMIMSHSIEEKMMKLKAEKSKLFNDIMDNAENKTKSIISKKDFDFLLE